MSKDKTNVNDVTDQLYARFGSPLEGFAKRRLVIWHDADGSFESEFDRIATEGLDEGLTGGRPLRFAKVDEGSQFALKKLVYRNEPGSDFLIYSRSQKDLSPRGLEGNWLADIELIAEHFQADFSSMLLEELGAVDTAVEGIERFKEFFGAAERKRKFVKLMPNAQSKEDVALGVMGSILGTSDLSTSQMVKVYLIGLLDGGDPLAELAKYGADGPFALYMQSRLGYVGDLQAVDDIVSHVMLTALTCTLPAEVLAGLEDYASQPHGQFCLNVVDDWMRDESFGDDFYELCRRVERACNLEQRLSQIGSADLAESDTLPCINERILVDLMSSMAQGADRATEALALAKRRKDLAWYSRVEPYFDALTAAAEASRFFREHAQGFHYAVPADVWKAYTDDWYRMDTIYRRFCRACDKAMRSAADIPVALDYALENLTAWMERIYSNWFLSDANACLVNACEKQWFDQGYVEGVDRQKRFFEEKVLSGASGAKKTLVIVSDALRYEVAAELAERLERDTKGSAELGSVHGVFPSITEFGMAALLPHNTMSFD